MLWENKSSLAKAAIVLSTILCLSIGLCGVGAILPSNPREEFNFSAVSLLGALGCVISILGLVLVMVFALGNYLYGSITGKGDEK